MWILQEVCNKNFRTLGPWDSELLGLWDSRALGLRALGVGDGKILARYDSGLSDSGTLGFRDRVVSITTIVALGVIRKPLKPLEQIEQYAP